MKGWTETLPSWVLYSKLEAAAAGNVSVVWYPAGTEPSSSPQQSWSYQSTPGTLARHWQQHNN